MPTASLPTRPRAPVFRPERPVVTINPKAEIIVPRRARRTERELIQLARSAPVLSLDRTAALRESAAIVMANRDAGAARRKDTDPTLVLLDRRPDLAGLPLRRGEECRLSAADASHFVACVENLRGHVHDAGLLRKKLTRNGPWQRSWLLPDSIGPLMQLGMVESAEVREVLVEHLARIADRRATAALTQLALFDLSPLVRQEAVRALAPRPVLDYRPALLKGLRFPAILPPK